MLNYDVIVVGGGISGSMAAISSARNGAKTLLIEKYGFLGGMLTVAGVGPMMSFHVEDRQVIKGSVGAMIDRLVEKKKSPGHVIDTIGYTYTVTPFDAEAMKHELELMLLEQDVTILYHTVLADVQVTDRNIDHITVSNKAGLTKLKANVYIDATGDGDLSAWSGVEFVLGRPSDGACQPMTMNMKMNHVDMKAVRVYMEEHPEEFPAMADNGDLLDKAPKWGISGFKLTEAKGKEDGSLGFNGEGILFFETNNEGEVIVNTTRIRGYDSTDPWKLAEAEIEGRRQVRCLEKFLKERVRGFENAVLLSTGPGIGVRSSRQIKGIYTITLEDITSCKKFDDVVAHAGYPADVHNPHGTEEIVKEEDNVKYGSMYSVPYRALVNDKVDNIITVGRCLSATFEAHGAVRTTPIVGAVAQAGGVAAALAVKNGQNTRDIDVKEMQRILLSEGAYLDI